MLWGVCLADIRWINRALPILVELGMLRDTKAFHPDVDAIIQYVMMSILMMIYTEDLCPLSKLFMERRC